MTVALLTNLLSEDELNSLTRMPFDEVLSTERVCISPLSLMRAGFKLASDSESFAFQHALLRL